MNTKGPAPASKMSATIVPLVGDALAATDAWLYVLTSSIVQLPPMSMSALLLAEAYWKSDGMPVGG